MVLVLYIILYVCMSVRMDSGREVWIDIVYKLYEETIPKQYYLALTATKNFDLSNIDWFKFNGQNTTIFLVCCRFCLERKTKISMTWVHVSCGGGVSDDFKHILSCRLHTYTKEDNFKLFKIFVGWARDNLYTKDNKKMLSLWVAAIAIKRLRWY